MDDDRKEKLREARKLAWKKAPLKVKLIIIGIGVSFFSFLIFIVVIITPLLSLGIIKGTDSDVYLLGYSDISARFSYWWPVGSSETKIIDGKLYATGTPVPSKSSTFPDGISSYFGPREVPTEGATTDHGAIDIPVPEGTNVIAPIKGKISNVNTDPSADGCGIYVSMTDINSNNLLFCHLSEVKVSPNDDVDQGQVIALSGNTGTSTGPHLHFAVKVNGTAVDPLNYVSIDNPRPVGIANLSNLSGGYGTSSENKSAMCSSLLTEGYSPAAVAGVLVNVAHEGSFLTNNMENCYENGMCCNINGSNYGLCTKSSDDPLRKYASDTLYTSAIDTGEYSRDNFINDSVGYGLIQWTSGGRKSGLYDLAKKNNASIADLNVQISHLFSEITGGSYIPTMDALTNQNISVYEVATIFCTDFERPAGGKSACEARAYKSANEYLTYVNNGCK